jgi:NADH-quinone oxidoreductase subunit K
MMGPIPMEHGLLLAAALFCLGLAGLIMRRNVLFMLMAAEIMMNATALAFVVAGARWAQADGQVMFVLVLTLQATEACVGLALVIQLYRRFRTLDVDAAATMKG